MKGVVVGIVIGATVATVGFARSFEIAEQWYDSAKQYVIEFDKEKLNETVI